MGTRDLRREIDALKNRARVGRSASRRERLPFDVELLRRVESAETSAELPELQPYRRLEKDGWVVGLSGAERATAGAFGVRLARSRIEVVITTDGTHGTRGWSRLLPGWSGQVIAWLAGALRAR